jgi:predicted NACHT family NTPase
LGELGSGKTSLMRRLALRLGERRNVTVPVFIELRDLEKSRSLDALLGQHFPQHGMKRFDYQAFREMLVEGRIVLLFDGFDQLAERVTARAAARHLETVLQAATGDAKVVITSRTGHFMDEQQGLHEFGERVIRRGFRMARLVR